MAIPSPAALVMQCVYSDPSGVKGSSNVREVVELVLKVENEAKIKIEDAKRKATEIRTAADEAAALSLAGVREAVVAESRARLERAKAEAGLLLQKAREADAAEGENMAAGSEKASNDIVHGIVTMMTGQSA
jgi:hypothetical protein